MPQVSLADLITAGQAGDRLISFPTDTVPALAVRPDRAELIFTAKQRSATKPLILMGACAEDLWPYTAGSKDEVRVWREVVDRYWPGALTLVLPASDRLPLAMNPTDPTTIGIRVPDCAIARHILERTQPLATTSVNRSGQPPLQTIAAINAEFPEVLTLSPQDLADLARSLPDFARGTPDSTVESASGKPSTVVKWTGQGWEVLRQGAIALES
ncbi:MAG: L-threonylcarbamoyladenylate synthase [Synechococcales bacterium]|nr:L-threonylcarbamoyladenylate synthase [Synechococcales bacterium]